jgi:hypothetical protein
MGVGSRRVFALLLFAMYTVEVRHANLATEHGYKVIEVCDYKFKTPAEDARRIKVTRCLDRPAATLR